MHDHIIPTESQTNCPNAQIPVAGAPGTAVGVIFNRLTDTSPLPFALNTSPPASVYVIFVAVPAKAAVTIARSVVIVVIAFVSTPLVVVTVIVSPTLKVVVKVVPTPVTAVVTTDTLPGPVVLCVTTKAGIGVLDLSSSSLRASLTFSPVRVLYGTKVTSAASILASKSHAAPSQ